MNVFFLVLSKIKNEKKKLWYKQASVLSRATVRENVRTLFYSSTRGDARNITSSFVPKCSKFVWPILLGRTVRLRQNSWSCHEFGTPCSLSFSIGKKQKTGCSLNIVFFGNFRIYSGLWPFSVPVCVHWTSCLDRQMAGRTPAELA